MRQFYVIPLTLRQANAFVLEHHRHHKPDRGAKFSIGLVERETERMVGVAIVGRPKARAFDDGLTAEVTRTCTDGTKNANSALYGSVWKAVRAMGYLRLVTYTEASESGVSLRAAGFTVVAERPARGNWHESSVRLRDLRDPSGRGGVQRTLWDRTADAA